MGWASGLQIVLSEIIRSKKVKVANTRLPNVGDVSHKPGGRLPLLSARPAVTLATLKRAATSFAA